MAKIQTITPNDPSPPSHDPSTTTTTIFLAGPTNDNWRASFTHLFQNALHHHHHQQQQQPPPLVGREEVVEVITIIDPTQPRWDGTWAQDYHDAHDPRLRTQLDWELGRQASAGLVVFYFAAGQQGPVSLLELGLALGQRCSSSSSSKKKSVLVGCQEGYWKRGNVQAVCARYGVSLKESLEDLVEEVVATCGIPA